MDKIDEEKAAIKQGVDLLIEHVFRQQTAQHVWPPDGLVDMASFFADLHTKVTNAYEESKESEPTAIVWIDPDTGEEASSGTGIPSGLPISMVEIVFDVLGFCRAVGIEFGAVSADIGVAYNQPEVSASDALEMVGEDGPRQEGK